MKKSIILYAIPAVIAILSATACGTKLPDTTTTTTTTTPVVDAKSTPVFKGTGHALQEDTNDLTMYKTSLENEYCIPNFFKGVGELLFFWDKNTNTLSLEESYTAMSNGFYPIYIMSQDHYNSYKGSRAQRSFYEPTDKTFFFDVVMETADDDGMVYVETVMTFKVISIVE